MSAPAASAVVPPAVPRGNAIVQPRLAHMEVMDLAKGDAWLRLEPVAREQFKALAVEAPFMKSGLTTSACDAGWFGRSPGAAADGPLETRIIGGLSFGRVARVRKFNGLPKDGSPAELIVEKHQSLGFDAGRTVEFVRLADGSIYVELTEARAGQPAEALPRDWTARAVALQAPWTVELPCPTRAWFFASLRSFHGPLRPGQLPPGMNLT